MQTAVGFCGFSVPLIGKPTFEDNDHNAPNSATGNDQDDEIRNTSSTLTCTSNATSSPRWQYLVQASDLDNNLTLSGGWSSGNNCASQTSSDPTDTVLDAQHNGPGLVMVTVGGDPLEGDVVVRNLTITRGFTSVSSSASGFTWSVNGASISSLLAENLLVIAGNATVT